ncbi:putative E3 ubiquitin-protein ligase XBOS34 [Apostasia shenzhenica]|uniref:Putative E3 ubiquitin-protein ligase XBOS34 n=1 Tax=Apostasia shenzhenica TaxID=1088818 RepID=A0A2I0AUR6_9ASPA|nr:putative E3 ubiquitin-protein ligase XBOS34 [Apostasia shenzhenica]
MGASSSKEELLYQQVNYGNAEGIKGLRRDGAGLEWIDREGKTPLILACMRPDLLHVAKLLIELGANVNVYRPGSHAGTPMHHAAKKGLENTVKLLMSHGANPLVMNDDCETPLDLARAKGHVNVVRAIESRMCLFVGWLREINGPSILEAFAPQWVSKKIWAVVLPSDYRNPTNPQKFELAIYPDLQVSRPRTLISLSKAQIEQSKLNQPDPALIIIDTAKKTKYKFLSAHEGDKQQIVMFYNACRGTYQFSNVDPNSYHSAPPPAVPSRPNQPPPCRTSYPEDVELAMAINASIQTALVEGITLPAAQQIPGTNATTGWGSSSDNLNRSPNTNVGMNGWADQSASDGYNGWAAPDASHPKIRPNSSAPQLNLNQTEAPIINLSSQEAPAAISVPSAPPFSEAFQEGLIHYPSIDSSPVDFTVPAAADLKAVSSEATGEGSSNSSASSCVICFDKPVEGACIPCGHMAGCMSCLKEIKAKKGECPVCRSKIDQVVKLYVV